MKASRVMFLKLMEIENPLVMGADGVARVRSTDISLDAIVSAFESGYNADDLVMRHPDLQLADLYLVLSYYLRHRREVEEYLSQRQEASRSGNGFPSLNLSHSAA